MCYSCSLKSTAWAQYSHSLTSTALRLLNDDGAIRLLATGVRVFGPGNLPTCKLHIAKIRTCKPRSVFLHQRYRTGPAL